MKTDPLTRLMRRTERDDRGCLLFLGGRNSKGYGKATIGGKSVLAHRYVYAAVNGDIPPRLLVLHTCDVRHCVEPTHLFLGTEADNFADMRQKGRMTRLAKSTPTQRGGTFTVLTEVEVAS